MSELLVDYLLHTSGCLLIPNPFSMTQQASSKPPCGLQGPVSALILLVLLSKVGVLTLRVGWDKGVGLGWVGGVGLRIFPQVLVYL